MKPIVMLFIVLIAAPIAGCGHGLGRTAGCHGDRRPANPHGSVLAPGVVQPPTGPKGSCP